MFGGCFYGSRFYHLSYTCGRCVPIASNSNSKELEINEQIRDKEIRLSLNIDTNDFNTKVNQAAKFLQQGHKLKVSIRFRGREMAHTSLGLEVHKRFADALAGKAVVDKQPKLEGRSMMMFMSPAPNK